MSKKLFRRVLFWSVGLLLLPLVWVCLKELLILFSMIGRSQVQSWIWYAVGGTLYSILEYVFQKPMGLYVFGHELTHALSGILSGAKIHSFKAKATGGEVRLSKSNLVVALSPYVIPLYALVVVILFALVRLWWDDPKLTVGFQILLGMALAFHISMTYHAVHRRQSDLKVAGLFFSVVAVVLGNTLILAAFCLTLFRTTPPARIYAERVAGETWTIWREGALTAASWVKDQSREQKWIQ